ncbi:PREDICTED: uncharacterized protein LOC106809221 [Priapulus caudatus]|uniref:Uncharacterized protein LOC106809221 n=1 Tax=Priapulus caudatus TaxID=37621 RepID=A0ABM1E688_PRICU|nr:PREDICTED: uncharacterized protein LOC106809221 [Priapulus caudatus]XP_014667709.1 PREDICTED: uncharacterized protein LOC106809221 [Priapulus caudatus]XP_014667711.1 PREDICTED: uncharacterized protein LOC106809221 [Priapulus caudatus]XP_014667712.1 PREDICTED: uncharacterized protein LOC106809221 [Priapulus caudatus]XP_014667713.1 PREDICTED: uncharacterized protein LOC106809221 [Priapulus caudatus]
MAARPTAQVDIDVPGAVRFTDGSTNKGNTTMLSSSLPSDSLRMHGGVANSLTVVPGRRRRYNTCPSEWWVTLKGSACLCFIKDGSSFEGNLVTDKNDMFGVQGVCMETHRTNHISHSTEDNSMAVEEKDKIASLIREEDSGFVSDENDGDSFDIEVIDLDERSKAMVTGVVRTHFTSPCSMDSDVFHFTTVKHIVGHSADAYIRKNLSHRFMGSECFVCIGPMEVRYKRTSEDELCRTRPQYIF